VSSEVHLEESGEEVVEETVEQHIDVVLNNTSFTKSSGSTAPQGHAVQGLR